MQKLRKPKIGGITSKCYLYQSINNKKGKLGHLTKNVYYSSRQLVILSVSWWPTGSILERQLKIIKG